MSCCLVCGTPGLLAIERFAQMPRITSDCRPFPKGGELAQCPRCTAVQKYPAKRWLAEIEQIYAHYAPYHQAEGNEQLSADARQGRLRPRSAILMERLCERIALPGQGTMLDVGCGNGATLRAFSEKRPLWNLEGCEMSDRAIEKLREIERFSALHTCPISAIRSKYDVVTMVHSLEHFVDPLAVLKDVTGILDDDGQLFIEVCNIEENPFDVLIADHLMHFSPLTLPMLLARAGLESVAVATDWISKEISAVAKRVGRQQIFPRVARDPRVRGWGRIDATLNWLGVFLQAARNVAEKSSRFGLFGTSISGTWLASQLADSVHFFVDEDPSRTGKTHLGRPVLSPGQVAEESDVYLALTPAVARVVFARLSGHPGRYILPPGEPFA